MELTGWVRRECLGGVIFGSVRFKEEFKRLQLEAGCYNRSDPRLPIQ